MGKVKCPNCGEATISNLAILRSASGVGLNPKCKNCGIRFSVGSSWQGNFVGSIIIAFIVSLLLSLLSLNVVPFLIVPAVFACASFAVCYYAKPKVAEPVSLWRTAVNYFVLLTVALMVVSWLIGL